MTTEELKQQARDKTCQETGQCVYNNTEDAKKAVEKNCEETPGCSMSEKQSTTNSNGNETDQPDTHSKTVESNYDGIMGYTSGDKNTDVLLILAVVGVLVVLLLLGIFSKLNKIAKKKN